MALGHVGKYYGILTAILTILSQQRHCNEISLVQQFQTCLILLSCPLCLSLEPVYLLYNNHIIHSFSMVVGSSIAWLSTPF